MLTMGSIHPIIWDDDWTVVTEDGCLSAQFEHTLLITENGAEILTQLCAPDVEFNSIGKVINAHADRHRYGVVQTFVGHGVGRVFHSDPVILHYRNNERGRMVLNQTFTIVVTEDGSLSAQFEHTLLITENGAEILTQC
nr:methionine aminopeptidase 1D, chloroplastic/mitochondrial isoform X1 [Tanacetum cinerariifolium]